MYDLKRNLCTWCYCIYIKLLLLFLLNLNPRINSNIIFLKPPKISQDSCNTRYINFNYISAPLRGKMEFVSRGEKIFFSTQKNSNSNRTKWSRRMLRLIKKKKKKKNDYSKNSTAGETLTQQEHLKIRTDRKQSFLRIKMQRNERWREEEEALLVGGEREGRASISNAYHGSLRNLGFY